MRPTCRLLLHGVAASPSSCKALVCLPDSENKESGAIESRIAYGSHGILSIAECVSLAPNKDGGRLWNVCRTLRTSTLRSKKSTGGFSRIITAISLVRPRRCNGDHGRRSPLAEYAILCGFSDGTITSWLKQTGEVEDEWKELMLVHGSNIHSMESFHMDSVTDLDGDWVFGAEGDAWDESLTVSFCTSSGARMVYFKLKNGNFPTVYAIHAHTLVSSPANTVHVRPMKADPSHILYLVGSASPRYNMIHVFVGSTPVTGYDFGIPRYCGSLKGHEDWITALDWHSSARVAAASKKGADSDGASDMLASSSQDAKIRLWKFTTYPYTGNTPVSEDAPIESDDVDDDEIGKDKEDDEEEGEARMEIIHGQYRTLVTLEALLIGHEERVTSVAWHPDPRPVYGRDQILLSSSMDRSIFLWGEQESGIWTPVSRVGSAGGILGGSIGSTLLGFINVRIDPAKGQWILGHAYGGAIHCYQIEKKQPNLEGGLEVRSVEDDQDFINVESKEQAANTLESRIAMYTWRAQPCITGHFNGVTDLSWESNDGAYLVTVGTDQTCRVWAPIALASRNDGNPIWAEIARPQVHGYGISAVISVSTPSHPHFLASGSDEKDIRGFDATSTFLKLLKSVSCAPQSWKDDPVKRVERAYIPSLGLSNKSSSADGAEQDNTKYLETNSTLPLEKDLGALSQWPESCKLYGHNTEIMRLACTTAAHNLSPESQALLVASSAKARNAEDASIRIWDVFNSRCLQTLLDGHRSTVTALDFSPDGKYLASSGKDRRLCIWQRSIKTPHLGELFHLAVAVDVAHKRIVWGLHYCPADASIFVSGSRDGTIKVWKISETELGTDLACMHIFSPQAKNEESEKAVAVTAVAFAPSRSGSKPNEALLAIGLENGLIELWTIPIGLPSLEEAKPRIFYQLPPHLCHIATVTKLAWKPPNTCDSEGLLLASCSTDHGTRIFLISSTEF